MVVDVFIFVSSHLNCHANVCDLINIDYLEDSTDRSQFDNGHKYTRSSRQFSTFIDNNLHPQIKIMSSALILGCGNAKFSCPISV